MKAILYFLLPLLFISIQYQAEAQKLRKEVTDTFYYDENWKKINPRWADYYRVPVKEIDGRFWVKYYRSNGSPYEEYHVKAVKVDYHYSIDRALEIRDGEYRNFYRDGSLQEEGQYIDGQQVGRWKKYYAGTDQPEIATLYYKNQPAVYVEHFYEDGSRKLAGLSVRTKVGNDTLYLENGTWIVYFRTGGTSAVIGYQMGLKHGPIVAYHSKGIKQLEGKFVTGNRDSSWVFYYEDGTKKREGNYINGNRDSIWTYYDSATHNIIKTISYEHGLYSGLYTSKYPSGTIRAQGMYKDDEKDGYWKYYDSSGAISSEGKYVVGEKDSIWVDYNTATNNIESRKVFSGNGRLDHLTSYYHDGRRRNEVVFTNGKGHIVTYDSAINDRIIQEGSIYDGKRVGEWTWYFLDGQVKAVENYKDGVPDGKLLVYDNSGALLRETQFKKGEKDGKETCYYPGTDKKWYIAKYDEGSVQSNRVYYRSGELKRKVDIKDDSTSEVVCYDKEKQEVQCPVFIVKPKFNEDVMNYISRNLQYPDEAMRKQIQGKVKVGFTIDEFGSVKDPHVIDGFDEECNAEAMRLIAAMPRWTPMVIDEIPVSSYKSLPIVFWLPDEED